MHRPLNVFIGCEKSGVIRRAFQELGHNAVSCDLQPADDAAGVPQGVSHIQGDALKAIRESWFDGQRFDLAIVHPPCTRLALSGALRLYVGGKKENGRDPAKWAEMRAGAAFFRAFFFAFDGALCAENPTMHGHALRAVGTLPGIVTRQTIQPHEFGDDASKATVLWLRGLPPLMPTHITQDFFAAEPPAPRIVGGLPRYSNQTDSGQNKLAPSPTRAAARAVTYSGVAKAMAQQWGEYLSR